MSKTIQLTGPGDRKRLKDIVATVLQMAGDDSNEWHAEYVKHEGRTLHIEVLPKQEPSPPPEPEGEHDGD